MRHKAMMVGALVASLLAASCLGAVAQAAGQERIVDPDAAALCMRLGDESRIEQCLEQLAPLSPDQAHAQELMKDPAVQAAVDAWSRDLDVAMADHARDLASKGDARSLLGAMLIMPTGPGSSNVEAGRLDPQAREWFARARQLGPDDPLVAWVEMMDCHALGCDRAAALDRLRRVDGDNAAVYHWAIGDALLSDDVAGVRENLHGAASARRYDPHSTQLLRLLLDARSGVRVPPMEGDVATVLSANAGTDTPADFLALQSMAQWAAMTMAPLQAVIRLCIPDAPYIAQDRALQGDCVAFLSALAADGSTRIYPQMATRLLVQVDPANASSWESRSRQFAWMEVQSAGIVLDGKAQVPFAEYANWVATDGEVAATSKLLTRSGIPITPPSDWLLPEQYR